MPDPRALRIDVGPFHLAPTPDAGTWTASAGDDAEALASGVTAGWPEWVALAQRVLQADAWWRENEARGDAWDEGFASARDATAVNPYR
ncbi:hypothetical protein [Microbacterium trichothecenolyticum]|uniref:Uncharacterized protein n=1 Tax=Microbacterium trichothecenolyticum TaxID=69370 RepID=A0ABU0TQD2_MICTR|nr:hypothetical protein [Microbacterium trichothecenolyticum]MDQ1121872.1 hypothetical protein [Microbacterium trichothecenolyticum]